jgi:hypothetical protein
MRDLIPDKRENFLNGLMTELSIMEEHDILQYIYIYILSLN